jgi:hypothetical protein
LEKVSSLSYHLFNHGFIVEKDDGFNFSMDLDYFVSQLDPFENVEPIEVIVLPTEDLSIPAEQSDDIPLEEPLEELTLEEIVKKNKCLEKKENMS